MKVLRKAIEKFLSKLYKNSSWRIITKKIFYDNCVFKNTCHCNFSRKTDIYSSMTILLPSKQTLWGIIHLLFEILNRSKSPFPKNRMGPSPVNTVALVMIVVLFLGQIINKQQYVSSCIIITQCNEYFAKTPSGFFV